MKNTMIASLSCTLFATLLGAGAAHAQKTYTSDGTTCRAGTVTVLAKADKLIV